jgi:thiamine-phosphate pyrophosphorylase
LNRPESAAEVIRWGAQGVAVVSAIVSADDPEQSDRELNDGIREAKRKWA